MTEISIDKIVSLCKRKGFVFPGSEIYGGFGNSYTYGPYGVELKNNIKQLWWKTFVHQRGDMTGIDGDIILHPKTWEASGHIDGFNDQMVDCRNCKARLRADHLLEDALGIDCEGWEESAIDEKISAEKSKIKCPKCGKTDFTEARKFNLMFSTEMAKTGENSTAYLRPETAQAIFLEFKNVNDSTRLQLPFGIAQIGKAFRNEITPGNFIFRRLEFEQMEIEYFIREDDWEKIFTDWQKAMDDWCDLVGLSSSKCHKLEHDPAKLSHYSKRTVDIEYDFPFGRKELYGLAYRTNFDLSQHMKFSGKKLTYRDPQTNEEFVPHVIEPTFGVDRTILAVLCEAYSEEVLEDESVRVVMKFPLSIAPVKIAILPLMKKDGLPEFAQKILKKVEIFGNCEYDQGGTIGKRYRRQDEVGTPFCITVDYDSLENNTITIRERDSMKQEIIAVDKLLDYLSEKFA